MFTKETKIVVATIAFSLIGLLGYTNSYSQESTGQYIDSAAITTKVKANLLADNEIKSLPIKVKTYKHTVQLTGYVDNRFQKRRAVQIAERVDGVADVQDALIVRSN